MRQTFIGRILAVTSESVIMSTVDPSRSEAIALQAGAVIREEAARLKGHVVRYTAEVSERTKCLSNPKFCIGSEYGLRAVFERREDRPEPDAQGFIKGAEVEVGYVSPEFKAKLAALGWRVA